MFVDIHHHLIYGLDDGPKTAEQTHDMLRAAHEDGITHIVATPHATPGRDAFPITTYLSRVEEARSWCQEVNLPINIYTGAEILYTQDTPRLLCQGQIPTLAQTRSVLVEFLPRAPYEQLRGAARTLGNAGYDVIFAHVERYACLRKMARMEELRDEYRIGMQMNASTVCEKQGFFEDRWIRKVIGAQMIDFVATDAHNTGTRRCSMKKCFDALKRQFGEVTARRLCIDNPMEIIQA